MLAGTLALGIHEVNPLYQVARESSKSRDRTAGTDVIKRAAMLAGVASTDALLDMATWQRQMTRTTVECSFDGSESVKRWHFEGKEAPVTAEVYETMASASSIPRTGRSR